MSVQAKPFGQMPDGTTVDLYTLTNANGLKVTLMTYGALVGVETPDRQGRLTNVALSLETLADYLAGHPFFGSIAGRFANRIAREVHLDGSPTSWRPTMARITCMAGEGIRQGVWKAEPIQQSDLVGVALTHVSPDGDEGYLARSRSRFATRSIRPTN